MVGWYSTFGVCKDGSEIARFCSFKKKRCIKGRNWNLHNGKLQPPDHSDLRNVKVKVHPNSNGSLAECEAEMRKVDFAKLVIQTCPELKDFGVACTFIAEVNKDGNVHCAKFPKKKNKTG
nr:hypothetical protein BaRGS_022460 [Batillaria attramentaria]